MASDIELSDYLRAEREFEAKQARTGLIVHAIITAVIGVALILVNVLVAPDFPWSAFAVGGLLIGLAFHFFGIRNVDRAISERQDRVVASAQRRAA